MQISNNYQTQNFGNFKFDRNISNTIKKAVYTNSGLTDAARKYNIKVSKYNDVSNIEKTTFDIVQKGKLFAKKLKGHIDVCSVHIKEITFEAVENAMEKAYADKIAAKKLAKEVKNLEKTFKKSLRR